LRGAKSWYENKQEEIGQEFLPSLAVSPPVRQRVHRLHSLAVYWYMEWFFILALGQVLCRAPNQAAVLPFPPCSIVVGIGGVLHSVRQTTPPLRPSIAPSPLRVDSHQTPLGSCGYGIKAGCPGTVTFRRNGANSPTAERLEWGQGRGRIPPREGIRWLRNGRPAGVMPGDVYNA